MTSLIQVADLIAYLIAWGLRIPGQLEAPGREELAPFAEQVWDMEFRTRRRLQGQKRATIFGFKLIKDLRGWEDQGAPDA